MLTGLKGRKSWISFPVENTRQNQPARLLDLAISLGSPFSAPVPDTVPIRYAINLSIHSIAYSTPSSDPLGFQCRCNHRRLNTNSLYPTCSWTHLYRLRRLFRGSPGLQHSPSQSTRLSLNRLLFLLGTERKLDWWH